MEPLLHAPPHAGPDVLVALRVDVALGVVDADHRHVHLDQPVVDARTQAALVDDDRVGLERVPDLHQAAGDLHRVVILRQPLEAEAGAALAKRDRTAVVLAFTVAGRVAADDQRPAALAEVRVRCAGHRVGRDQRIERRALERKRRAGRVLLVEQPLVAAAVGGDLVRPPLHLLQVQPVGQHVLAVLVLELEVLAHLGAVFDLPEPGHEDGDELTLARLSGLPHLVELVAQAVGGGLEDDLRARQVADGVTDTRQVRRRVVPEGELRTVQQLRRVRPAHILGARGGQLVAAVEPVEDQLLRVRRARADWHRVVLVVALDHREQVVGRLLLVRHDEGALAEVHRGAVIEPRPDVGRDPLLPSLQDQSPDFPGLRQLFLEALVHEALRRVEQERLLVAALVQDLQAVRAVDLKVALQVRELGEDVVFRHQPSSLILPSSSSNRESPPVSLSSPNASRSPLRTFSSISVSVLTSLMRPDIEITLR